MVAHNHLIPGLRDLTHLLVHGHGMHVVCVCVCVCVGKTPIHIKQNS